MVGESRRAVRYALNATAEVEHSAVVRKARVKDLCIHGCYLAMPDPFSKGASVRIKIRTEIEFFQADATVAHATHELGMGVMFHAVSPPFQIVLQHWLSEAQQAFCRMSELMTLVPEFVTQRATINDTSFFEMRVSLRSVRKERADKSAHGRHVLFLWRRSSEWGG
jgi:hypothetical protein